MPDVQDLSLPESFFLLALRGGWDQGHEKVGPGSHGGGMAGALVMELALRRRILVQRNRIQLAGDAVPDGALEAVAQALRPLADTDVQSALAALGDEVGTLYTPFKDSLQEQGLITHRNRRILGVMKRSEAHLTDPGARDSLVKNATRLLIGGTPNAREVAFLGLAEASGLLTEFVPTSAIPFNARRIHGLVLGRDELGYRVHDSLRQVQAVAYKAILDGVRALS